MKSRKRILVGMGIGTKVRTMSRKQLWKPLCGLLVLLFIPLPGRSDVVQDWDAIMQATVSSQPPFPQARFAAITQLAVFEAVNAITRQYKPYLGTITAPQDASPEAAAVAAAYGVLSNYFPDSLSTLNAAYASSLAAIPDGPGKMAGIATGQAAAGRGLQEWGPRMAAQGSARKLGLAAQDEREGGPSH